MEVIALDNIKAAIFDMDGTLIDSMWVWDKIDVDYLGEKGISLPSDLRQCIEPLSFDECAKYFKDRFNLPDSLEEIKDRWNEMAYDEYAHNVDLKPFAKEYLTLLKSKGIKLSLATSNSVVLLEAVLSKHGILHLFDSITTTSEVQKGKDFPDVYLLAAKKLCASPENCVVYEDILPAMMGAKLAGMKVVGVYDEYSEGQIDEMKNVCDYFIEDYECLFNNSYSLMDIS